MLETGGYPGTIGDVIIMVLFGVTVLLFISLWLLVRTRARMRRMTGEFEDENRRRLDRSRSVLMGQVTEHLVPLLPGFPYSLKDARFMGQPVDYLVFDGLEARLRQAATGNLTGQDAGGRGKQAGNKEIEVVFCEIKTGQSRLSPPEAALRDAIRAGRVRFEVWRLLADGRLARED